MKKTHGFEKFANKKKAGTIKEEFRKERREVKTERAEAIRERYLEKKKTAQAKREDQPAPSGRPGPIKKTGSKKPATPITGIQSEAGEISTGQMPLNKFIAHCGVCARRDAAALVKEGIVTVNNNLVTEPGFKVTASDIVTVKGKRISLTRNLVYILLNKPKDYITTTEDPQERKTVMELIKTATTERVYPIGRLDRNTSGVLLFTNDGDLAQTLSHPKNQVKKIYEVKLDKPLTKNDFDTIRNGVTLEDGFVAPDALGYADPKDKTVIGIEIHSGRNRIVRRIFEHLKYDVRGLDRVMYAGLTKKNVIRGKWRLLTEKEVRILKHFNKSSRKEKSAE